MICARWRRAEKAAAPDRFQELRRTHRTAHRAGADRRRRPQWLRQVEPARGDPLGHGRIESQVDARRRHGGCDLRRHLVARSEEHTSELQSLMRISYAVFCLKKNKNTYPSTHDIEVTRLT